MTKPMKPKQSKPLSLSANLSDSLTKSDSRQNPAKSPDTDYSIRYAENWRQTSKNCKDSTNGICCYPGCYESAVESHHALYFDKLGAVAGREVSGVHIFPGCAEHVSMKCCSLPDNAHNWRNWIRPKKNPVLGNRNTAIYYKKLRQGWLEKSQKVSRTTQGETTWNL